MNLGYWLFSDSVIAVGCYSLVILAFMIADYYSVESTTFVATHIMGH